MSAEILLSSCTAGRGMWNICALAAETCLQHLADFGAWEASLLASERTLEAHFS